MESAEMRESEITTGKARGWSELEKPRAGNGSIGEVRESSMHFTMVSLFYGVRYIPFRSKRIRHTFLAKCTCMALDTIIIIFFLK